MWLLRPFRLIALILAIFGTLALHAEPKPSHSLENLLRAAQARVDRLLKQDAIISNPNQIRDYRYKGAKFLRDGANEQLLAEAQQILKRGLTDDEINACLLELLETTREGLSVEIDKPKGYRPGISGSSKISLPDGTTAPMNSLRLGKKILSVDIFTGQTVENEVTAINVYRNSKWRYYFDTDEMDPSLRASPHQLVFVPTFRGPAGRVIQLMTVYDARFWQLVYKFIAHGVPGKELQNKSLGFEVRRSRFYNKEPLYSLTLAHEPRTFIADLHVLPDDELCRQALL